MIMNHLHDDNCSLMVCARVCKALGASCRFHLLVTIKIHPNDTLEKFCEALQYHKETWRSRVWKLTIGSARANNADNWVSFSLLEVLQLLVPLPILENLVLLDLSGIISERILVKLSVLSPQLRSLTISGCHLSSQSQIVDMIKERCIEH